MMLKRSIGVGLIVFGVLVGVIPGRNLWTISAAWNRLDQALPGIEFSGINGVQYELQQIWNENLVTQIAAILIALLGVLILVGPKLRVLERLRLGQIE